MKRLLPLMPVLLTVLFLCLPADAGRGQGRPAAGDAKVVSEFVQTSVNKVLDVLKDKELSWDAKRDKVVELIEPILDMQLMAKLTLGRQHWPGLGEEQKTKFTDLFKEQLKAACFEKMDLFGDGVVEYSKPELIKEKKYQMVTRVASKGQRIEMTYKLYHNGKEWKIYDLEVEGVSIVKSYGSQYDEFLQKNTFEALLKKMKGMIQDAKEQSKVKKESSDKKASTDKQDPEAKEAPKEPSKK